MFDNNVSMRNSAYMTQLVEKFKAAGEETRLRILALLVQAGSELCACELIDVLDKPQYAISRHLGVLVAAGLLGERREGRNMFYRLLVGGEGNLQLFQAVAAMGSGNHPELAADRQRLADRLALREGGCCTKE